MVDLYGVVDDQVAGHERVDAFRVTAESFAGIAAGCEIDDGWNACKIL